MTQAERISDFESRANHSPESVYVHQQNGWRYIPIHPFSDEPTILRRLKLNPSDCLSVDAYWEVEGDIVFIETIAHKHADRDPGLYCRTRAEGGKVAFAVLKRDFVTRVFFEDAMRSYYSSGRLFNSHPGYLTLI